MFVMFLKVYFTCNREMANREAKVPLDGCEKPDILLKKTDIDCLNQPICSKTVES